MLVLATHVAKNGRRTPVCTTEKKVFESNLLVKRTTDFRNIACWFMTRKMKRHRRGRSKRLTGVKLEVLLRVPRFVDVSIDNPFSLEKNIFSSINF